MNDRQRKILRDAISAIENLAYERAAIDYIFEQLPDVGTMKYNAREKKPDDIVDFVNHFLKHCADLSDLLGDAKRSVDDFETCSESFDELDDILNNDSED